MKIMDVRQTVDLIKEKKMGVERLVDLNKKIMGERNRRLVSQRKKNGYWTNRRFELKRYEKDGCLTNRRLGKESCMLDEQ